MSEFRLFWFTKHFDRWDMITALLLGVCVGVLIAILQYMRKSP